MRTTLSIVFLATLTLAACSKKRQATTPPAGPTRPAATSTRAKAPAPGTATVTGLGDDAGGMPRLGPIRFEFDSIVLSAEARATLDALAAWMTRNQARVLVEGHADERGTTEYNVALGQRRAQVIADYLARLGVSSSRVETISYGEERPAVAGAGEDAWAQNRRGEIRTQP